MEKISERKSIKLAVTVSKGGQLSNLDYQLYDKIFLGNPFCLKAADNPLSSRRQLEELSANSLLRKKLVLHTPLCPLEEEMPSIVNFLKVASQLQIPAVCVQSLGFAHWIKKEFPEFKIYFGCFSNVYSLQDAQIFKEEGSNGGLLSWEVDIKESEYILKNSGLEIILPIAGFFPLAFSRYCFFHAESLPKICPNECQNDHYLVYPRGATLKQKGKVIYSGKALSLLEDIEYLLTQGFYSFRIEGWIMDSFKINTIAKIFWKAINVQKIPDKHTLSEIFPEGICNGFLSSKKGMQYHRLKVI